MKLHLPIALLTAVISAMSYTYAAETTVAVAPERTITYDGSSTADPDKLTTGLNKRKIYDGHIEAVYTGNWEGQTMGTGATLKDSKHKGIVSPFVNDTIHAATSSEVILTGEGTRATKVAGGGGKGYWVTGDKTVTITDGAYVGIVYGGFMDNNGGSTVQALPDNDLYENVAPEYTENNATITVNVTNGASSATIYGGSYYGGSRMTTFANKGKGADYWFSADNALALKDAININVKDAEVRGSIYGGGMSCSSVDDTVSITISGDSNITGSVYGGSAGGYENEKGSVQTFIDSSLITVNGGVIGGNVYGGGGDVYSSVLNRINEGTKIVLNGGTVKGSVYASGKNDELYGGSHVVVKGDATVEGNIIGGAADAKDDCDHVITFDNHGDVSWDKVDGFNVVELTGGTSTTLGEDAGHTLSTDFEKVVISGPSTTVTGKIGHAVELDITKDCWVELDGPLTTKAGSEIEDNTTKDIVIHGNATFNGTSIKNSTIKADGNSNIEVLDGSTVKDANLVAANGNVSIVGSTMNGGEITVGGTLLVSTSQVKVDKIHGGEEIALNIYGTPFVGASSLEVNQDIKIAAGSQIMGWDGCFEGQQIGTPYNSSLTAKSITAEKKLSGNYPDIFCADLTATEGNVAIGGGNSVGMSNLVAKDSVVLKDGASLTHGSTATAQTGDVWLNGGVKVENSDLIAENGIVKFNQSTMNGGNIVAGEALQMDNASVVVADSINNGKAVKLDVNSGAYLNLSEEPTAASLTVNSDLVLADGSKFEGQKKVPYVTSDNNKDVEGLLKAHSIKSEGAVTFDLATVKATEGNIELATGSSVTNTNLVATDSVQLTGTTMEGGSIAAGNKVVLDKSVVSVNSIGTIGTDGTIVTDGAVVKSTNSQLEVTQGALVLNSGSEVTNSSLTATNGDVVLSGTKMSGSTVTTNGEFFIKDNSEVTMGTLEGLNNIHISDSSLSTEKLVVNKGETFKVTGDGVDRTGDKLILSGTGVALEEAFVVNGEATIKDATLVITGSNSQLGIAYGANGGKLVIDGSNVDMHEASTLHMGYNAGEAGELIITNGSNFLSASNNAWLGGGKVEVSNGSTLDVCNSENSYNYRTIMGWEGHTLDVAVTTGEKGASTFNTAATQLITNYHSDTKVNILVSGKDSSFNHAGTIESNSSYAIGATGEWVEKDGKWYDKGTLGLVGSGKGTTHTLTYLLDAGTDEYGAKKAAVNNVFTTITAEKGGSVNIDSAITYVGGFQDVATFGDNLNKKLDLNIGEGSSMSFKQMEIYANTDINFVENTTGGTFTADKITVHSGTKLDITGTGRETSSVVINGTGKPNDEAIVVDGTMNITNTNLVMNGGNSQLGIGYGADGGVLNVTNSKVDLSEGTTLHIGYNAGMDSSVLNISGSEFIGGSNNAWLGGGTINVTDKSTLSVCSSKDDHYNYRVLMGLAGNTVNLNVESGSKFESNASQFVTNFNSGTDVYIKVDGAGSTFTQNAKINSVAAHGVTDTITYLLDSGTDAKGNKYDAVNNVRTVIAATNGGTVAFNSGVTYVGSAQDKALGYTDKALALIVGDKASMSFKQMELYANTVINFEKPVSDDSISGSIGGLLDGSNADKYTTGGSFSADKITVHAGTKLDVKGNGTDSGSQLILNGTGKSNDEALVVDGTMNVNNANLVMKGTNSQLGIGYGADGGVLNVTNSKVDLSEGTTLHMGYNAGMDSSVLNIKNSEFIGGSNNAWLGGGTINVTEKSTLSVCSTKDNHYNYRTILGLSGNTLNLNVESGSKFESSASQFITNFSSGTEVNIKVDGEGSSLVHNNKINSKPSYGFTETTTYLLDSGTDANGKKYDAVNNVKTNITASNGGKVTFGSDVTYVGSAQDKAAGYTNKKLNITVADSASSVTFGDMVIYADTTIDNKGDKADFSVGNISVNDGATLETLGSLDLNEVALAGGTLFNAGSLELDSLVLEHANLLFAVSDWDNVTSTIAYKGTELTDFRNLTVSINDMVDSYGIVLTGSAAEQLIAAGDEGLAFSFTLATGSDLFEEQLAYVLNAEENLADFSITVGDAVLRLADGELKDLKVEDTENGVVISGTAIIPEPTTATLSLLALAALAARRRRK